MAECIRLGGKEFPQGEEQWQSVGRAWAIQGRK